MAVRGFNEDAISVATTLPLVRVNEAHVESIDEGPEQMQVLMSLQCAAKGWVLYRCNRISSKYITPEPPVCGLFLSPKPIEIMLTLARSTP